MKIMHTGDWHIGKSFNQVQLTEDQSYVIEQLIEYIRKERPDVLIIAGDLYDRSVPPVEAVELLDRTFSRLRLEHALPVLVIAGNHDSPDRLGFGSRILEVQGLHIAGRLSLPLSQVTLEDQWGPVDFYLLPYAAPGAVRELLDDAAVRDHDSAMEALLKRLPKNEEKRRRVLVTHAYVRGAQALEESESEKPLSVGGTDYVSAAHFQDFSYVALGHLHRPQQAGSERIRYAGSLLKYSFSEVRQPKSLTLAEIDGEGEVSLKLLPLTPRLEVRKIKGNLQDLLAAASQEEAGREDYLHVTLTDDGEVVEPMARLRAAYPNVLALEREVRQVKEKELQAIAMRQRSKADLFADFYRQVVGEELNEERRQVVDVAVSAVLGKEEGK
ncbi:exonuclease SbcCD subunit D [Azotosporobacter soli]|uniref:exonuclease SbcCD subunit D n=1 Tax=Azotosporobacter soli TaxID=3055040 RepID=UPI0031FE8B9E